MENFKLTDIPRKTRGSGKKDYVDSQELVQQLVDLRIELKSAQDRATTEHDIAKSLQNDHRTLQIELQSEQEKTVALQGRIGNLEATIDQLKNVAVELRVLQAVHGIVDDDRRALFGMVGNALNSVIQEAPANKPTQIHPPKPEQLPENFG